MNQTDKLPLKEILRDVPEDGVHSYEVHTTHHKNIPYGEICKEALKEIQILEKLLELNMKDLWDLVDQRDWHYDECRKLKDRLNVA